MKKVLIIGDLNQTVSSINKQLSSRFQTQICKDDAEMVTGMMKVFDPELVLISLVGIGALDQGILDTLRDKYSEVPVLLLGTKEECTDLQDSYDSDQFYYAVRPTTVSVILNKCLKIMKMAECADTEERPTMFPLPHPGKWRLRRRRKSVRI